MTTIKRHTDVVASIDEFTSNYEAGLYVVPWIVYVGNDIDGYSVIYSNDEKRNLAGITPDFIDSLKNRIEALETEKIFCFEEEYDILVANGRGWVTNLDGSRSEVVYNESKMYFIYEDEGPIMEPENPTPEEPENPTPEEPETPVEPSEPTPEEPTPEEPENNNGTNESIGEGEGESEVTPETDPEEKPE